MKIYNYSTCTKFTTNIKNIKKYKKYYRFKELSSYFANFEQVKKISSYFADFEQEQQNSRGRNRMLMHFFV